MERLRPSTAVVGAFRGDLPDPLRAIVLHGAASGNVCDLRHYPGNFPYVACTLASIDRVSPFLPIADEALAYDVVTIRQVVLSWNGTESWCDCHVLLDEATSHSLRCLGSGWSLLRPALPGCLWSRRCCHNRPH